MIRRPRSGKGSQPSPRLLVIKPGDEARVEALTVAMALAPGVYARNRMFSLFKNPAVQRAKTRAAALRGIAQQLGRACAISLATEGANDGAHFVLKYQIPALRLARVAELTRVELATLRVMASRAGASCLPTDDEDRRLVESALAKLLVEGEPLAAHSAQTDGE